MEVGILPIELCGLLFVKSHVMIDSLWMMVSNTRVSCCVLSFALLFFQAMPLVVRFYDYQ
ncbi:hypothetical protein Taro_040440 [Colocasia esculenta]|uniref:Uncharacterized protein n=1 Tax=Colocasia esculenta TaxID=4460 RepID=A0A843WLX0_COLES|nr:hypothetical protein [Colocasia esculenta]